MFKGTQALILTSSEASGYIPTDSLQKFLHHRVGLAALPVHVGSCSGLEGVAWPMTTSLSLASTVHFSLPAQKGPQETADHKL